MPGLSDMEELLNRISNPEITDYMREALSCYSVGAYRACVVLCYIAVFDDLRKKIAPLSSINPVAKTIGLKIEKRAVDQQIYESYMIDQLKSAGLVTATDAFRLEQIRVLRNKAAHPSGVHPSPEEARYVYFESIDKFLSQQVLKTTHAVDALVARLGNDNFFPTRTINDVATIVNEEIAEISSLSMPYLVTKLVELCTSSSGALKSNVGHFISGLALKRDPCASKELQSRLLKAKSDDSSMRSVLLSAIAADPNLLKDLDKTSFSRLRSMMENFVADVTNESVSKINHPANMLSRLVECLDASFIEGRLKSFSELTISRFCYMSTLIKSCIKSERLQAHLVKTWKENAGSYDFRTANTFVEQVQQIEQFTQVLTSRDALELVTAVCKAGDHGAFGAIAAKSDRFASFTRLVLLARSFIEENPVRLIN